MTDTAPPPSLPPSPPPSPPPSVPPSVPPSADAASSPLPDLRANEHPLRLELSNEVHSRPPLSIEAPARISFLALLMTPQLRAAELQHISELCARFQAPPPPAGVSHFTTRLHRVLFTWERHGEFSGYSFTCPGLSGTPFSEPALRAIPADWISAIPGQRLVATHGMVIAASAAAPPLDEAALAAYFDGNVVVGGQVGAGSGAAFTDFRLHADGFSRFLAVDAGLTPRQAGQLVQRLLEIETYRMMALLALPIARQQLADMGAFEAALSKVTAAIATPTAQNSGQNNGQDSGQDEDLLHDVTRLSAQVEKTIADSQFRHGACAAYADLVNTRIAELRETRIAGIQPIGEFMSRRFGPAVATCATAALRLQGLSERVARASALLSTRVSIVRERQSQALLASMDRRAKVQLRLQQTVEGLSLAAIVYYLAGLVGYAGKALKSGGVPVDLDLLVGASIPVLAVLVVLAARKARKR